MMTAWPCSSALPPVRGCDVLSLSTTALSAQVLLPPRPGLPPHTIPGVATEATHTHTHTQSFTFLLIPSCPFLVAQMVKSPPTMQETQVQSLGVEDPLEKEMAIISSVLAWEIPWT